MGTQGQRAFDSLANSIAQSNVGLAKSTTFAEKATKAFGQALKWTVAYGTINKVT